MPKYIIHCSTSKSYWLTVEAPDIEAVYSFYSACDADSFHEGQEDNWSLHEVEEIADKESTGTDVVVNDEGDIARVRPEHKRVAGESESEENQ